MTILCRVSDAVIETGSVLQFISDFGHGAQTLFLGAVREKNAGRNVVAVSYDAATVLAEKILNEISEEAVAKWGQSLKICVIHRTGKLVVGDLSVAIGVSSRHRDEAYLASRYIIEQLKVRAPIWKKEYYSDGETEWLKGHALCQHTHGTHIEG